MFRRALDEYFERGRRDGLTPDRPPDPFMVSSHPGVTHRDNRHFRRMYDAGFQQGRREWERHARLSRALVGPSSLQLSGRNDDD